MIIGANSVPKDSELEADVVIVGTGAAGISLAFKFTNTPLKIIMIESGKMARDDHLQGLNDFKTTALPIEPLSRMRSFGGTTTLWGGKWKPHDAIDFSLRDWVPYSGWPIDRKELDKNYREASELLGMPILLDQDIPSFLKSESLKTHSFQGVRREYLDFGKRFGKLISQSENIRVYIEATVVGLKHNANTLEQVLIKTLQGNEFRVKGKIVVLACGGIENARLLLLSGIGNEFDQVGRYYMDHPKGEAGAIIPINPRVKISQTIGYGLSEKAQIKNRVLNSYVLFFPIYRRNKTLDKLPRLIRIFARMTLKLLLGNPKIVSSFVIKNYMEQEPNPENRITLGENIDLFGNRLPNIHWTISDLDKYSMRVLHKTLKEEMLRENFGYMTSPLFNTSGAWLLSEDASHHMGSTRMGARPQTSVVDKDCRVHSIKNLYMAGSSVFPTGGASSPTTTIVALALRLADHIAQKYFN